MTALGSSRRMSTCAASRATIVGHGVAPTLIVGERRIESRHERRGKRRVVEARRQLLAVMERPMEKVHELLSLLRVRLRLVDEDPGERGDRVRLRSGRIDDRDAIVGVRRAASARRRPPPPSPLRSRAHELSASIANRSGRQLVLSRVRELDIADGARRLLHLASDAFVALSRQGPSAS